MTTRDFHAPQPHLTTARVVEYLEQSGWARHGVLWQSPRHTRDLYEMREALALQAAAEAASCTAFGLALGAIGMRLVAELVSGVASPRIHRLPKEADHA